MTAKRPVPVEVNIIDLNFDGTTGRIAVYLIETQTGPVLVEAGPASTLEALRDGLAAFNYQISDIRDVYVTHIHLDHAGSCGWLAEQGCRIHVHEFGAKHLCDPTKLMESASRIYGSQTESLWGEVKPVPQGLLNPIHDGDMFDLGQANLHAYETPGHARHHHTLVLDDGQQRVCFCGDAAAMLIPEFDRFVVLPTPPPEFNLESWLASVDLLSQLRADIYLLTHFGRIADPQAHFLRVKEALQSHVDFIAERASRQMGIDQIIQEYQPWMRSTAAEAGVDRQTYDAHIQPHLIRMNVVGMMRYLEKKS